MMLSKYALAFGLATLTSLGGGDRSQRPIIRTTNSLPNMQAVDRFYAFNFLSPDLNEIDGSSAGNSFYTAWDLGYGSEWNNLVSQPITYAQNSPRPGDGRYSLNGQTWNNGLDGNGLPHGGLVDSLGLRQVGLTV